MEYNWEMIIGFSIVGILVIAIAVVLLVMLIAKHSKRLKNSKKNGRDWENLNLPTYKKTTSSFGPRHGKENSLIEKTEILVTDEAFIPNEDIDKDVVENRKVAEDEIKPKVLYFPLSKRNLFLKAYETNEFQCIFQANSIGGDLFEFSIISIEKSKAWDIGEAVLNVGTVLQQDAVGFKCIKKGRVQQKVDKGTTYWKILEKVQVEYLK